jgi:hypothetical protein
MRVTEILETTETHHALTPWRRVGPNRDYELAYDTHGVARSGERSVTSRIMGGILLHAFHTGIVKDIPRGTSCYIHDTNSGCSVVLERMKSFPFRFIVRTVMSAQEPPGNPRLTVTVPAIKGQPTAAERQNDAYLHHLGKLARERGVDAASQAVAAGDDIIPLNREQRRAAEKLKRKKV